MNLKTRFIITFFGLFGNCVCQQKINTTATPNIIVFLADDLGYGDLGCTGNPIIKTPNIDKFAGEGVLLTDCHSGGTVCSPSRAALLTGRTLTDSVSIIWPGAIRILKLRR